MFLGYGRRFVTQFTFCKHLGTKFRQLDENINLTDFQSCMLINGLLFLFKLNAV